MSLSFLVVMNYSYTHARATRGISNCSINPLWSPMSQRTEILSYFLEPPSTIPPFFKSSFYSGTKSVAVFFTAFGTYCHYSIEITTRTGKRRWRKTIGSDLMNISIKRHSLTRLLLGDSAKLVC